MVSQNYRIDPFGSKKEVAALARIWREGGYAPDETLGELAAIQNFRYFFVNRMKELGGNPADNHNDKDPIKAAEVSWKTYLEARKLENPGLANFAARAYLDYVGFDPSNSKKVRARVVFLAAALDERYYAHAARQALDNIDATISNNNEAPPESRALAIALER